MSNQNPYVDDQPAYEEAPDDAQQHAYDEAAAVEGGDVAIFEDGHDGYEFAEAASNARPVPSGTASSVMRATIHGCEIV